MKLNTRRKLIIEINKKNPRSEAKVFYNMLAWGILDCLLCLDSKTLDNMCMLYRMYLYLIF